MEPTHLIAESELDSIPADHSAVPAPSNHPTKGRRYRVLDGDEGDVCIVQCCTEGHLTFPAGTLLPIEGVPRFETKTQAKKWVAQCAGDLMSGMQFIIFTVNEVGNAKVENTPKISINWKPKKQIKGPPEE